MSQNEGDKGELTKAGLHRVFTGTPNLVMDLQTVGVLDVFKGELEDTDLDVRVRLFR